MIIETLWAPAIGTLIWCSSSLVFLNLIFNQCFGIKGAMHADSVYDFAVVTALATIVFVWAFADLFSKHVYSDFNFWCGLGAVIFGFASLAWLLWIKKKHRSKRH